MRRAIPLWAMSLLVGCGPGSAPDPSGSHPAHVLAASESDTARTVEIYAAVITQLVTRDHTFGELDPGFEVIYLMDGAVPGASDPYRTVADPATPFPSEVKEGLRQNLHHLPPLSFVAQRASVVTGDPPGHVLDGGVLLTLGPIVGETSKVEVEAHLWLNGLAASWLTYVVESPGQGWFVTGTTGPRSIA